MAIIKQEIAVVLRKAEVVELVTEALANEEHSASLKRVLAPLLVGKFEQFPDFTQISLKDTNEDGSINVSLKIKQERKEVVKSEEESSTEE